MACFSFQGELYIAESDSTRINRVRRVHHNKIELVAGRNSNCNCQEPNCKCYDPEVHLAAATRFSAISGIAVSPDGKSTASMTIVLASIIYIFVPFFLSLFF